MRRDCSQQGIVEEFAERFAVIADGVIHTVALAAELSLSQQDSRGKRRRKSERLRETGRGQSERSANFAVAHGSIDARGSY